jgi:pilus assembly protein Flp/PilA
MKKCNILLRKADSRRQKGASLVEYALLVALIAVIAIAALQLLGRNVSSRFSTIASSIGS